MACVLKLYCYYISVNKYDFLSTRRETHGKAEKLHGCEKEDGSYLVTLATGTSKAGTFHTSCCPDNRSYKAWEDPIPSILGLFFESTK